MLEFVERSAQVSLTHRQLENLAPPQQQLVLVLNAEREEREKTSDEVMNCITHSY